MSEKGYRGSCLCGRVQFSVDKFNLQAGHCHCSMCRKFHGAPFATLGSVPAESFHWIQGKEEVKAYTAENGTIRSFCQNCGSSLFFASPALTDGIVEVALGVFDDDIPVVPDVHIYLDSGANWVSVSDELPKFSAGRKSEKRS